MEAELANGELEGDAELTHVLPRAARDHSTYFQVPMIPRLSTSTI